jgi:dihydroneopterin aldolase
VTPLAVEVEGLAILARHGALPHEREHPQPFVFDLRLEPRSELAAASDRLEDAVDYGAVCERVAALAEERSYALLERLAEAVCADLLEAFPLRRARVRVRKPHAPLGRRVDWVAVTVEREAGSA